MHLGRQKKMTQGLGVAQPCTWETYMEFLVPILGLTIVGIWEMN